MQQASVILMQEHDHKIMCPHIQKKIKAVGRIVKVKTISLKLLHHTQMTTK
jgi:hypothetical protein